jgi:cytochrome c oxidase subunit 5a
VQDVFELQVCFLGLRATTEALDAMLTVHLQRNLNNAFAYDLVPSPGVCIAALKAARRVNDYPTAVRVFEGRKSDICADGSCHAKLLLTGIKAKVENTHQYDEYLEELKPLREEMGINLKEELYPEGTDSPYFNQ